MVTTNAEPRIRSVIAYTQGAFESSAISPFDPSLICDFFLPRAPLVELIMVGCPEGVTGHLQRPQGSDLRLYRSRQVLGALVGVSGALGGVVRACHLAYARRRAPVRRHVAWFSRQIRCVYGGGEKWRYKWWEESMVGEIRGPRGPYNGRSEYSATTARGYGAKWRRDRLVVLEAGRVSVRVLRRPGGHGRPHRAEVPGRHG